MDVPVVEAGAFGGDLAGIPEDLSGDRVTCRVPAVAGKEPLLRLAPEAAPVEAQRIEQLGLSMTSRSLPPLPSRI